MWLARCVIACLEPLRRKVAYSNDAEVSVIKENIYGEIGEIAIWHTRIFAVPIMMI